MVDSKVKTASNQANKDPFSSRAIPAWYKNAKLGIFIHWGLYSIPAFADSAKGTFTQYTNDLSSMRDTKGKNPYAEWYLNALRIPGSPTVEHHLATYGDAVYFDFQQQFEQNARNVNFREWAELFKEAGARYTILVTRHLDGYPLWPTQVPNPSAPQGYAPAQDIVGDITKAIRSQGLKMGMYYAGGIDWTRTKKPVRYMTDLMEQQAQGPAYAHYVTAQYKELIDRYQPSVLWNDMGWPAEQNPHEIFSYYYDHVQDGIVNDRWTQVKLPKNGFARRLYLGFIGFMLRLMAKAGQKIPEQPQKNHFDIKTYEYELPLEPPKNRTWELTRGLGNSFGYNAQETAANLLTGPELIRLLVEVVSKGGNLLINVGPDGQGNIPDIQAKPLKELGSWLKVNGDAIYDTRPWSTYTTHTSGGGEVYFTKKEQTIYAIVFAQQTQKTITFQNVTFPASASLYLLGSTTPLKWQQQNSEVVIELSDAPSGHAPYVVVIQ